MNATDWERVAERDPDHHARVTAHDRAVAAMARDVPAVGRLETHTQQGETHMSMYRVELRGQATEVYYVEAETPEAAALSWSLGDREDGECYDMGVERVELAEDYEQ